MISKIKKFFLIFTALVLILPALSFGQMELLESDINVEIYPLNPGPYTDTTITLSSYSFDLNVSMIEWQSGSKTVLSGYGKTTYSFKTLGANQATGFVVVITPPDSLTPVYKSITISPSDVQILWEAIDGYTPPFYKGKSFVSSEGLIKVVAIPNTNGTESSKKNLSYVWKVEGKTQQDVSGFNKDSYLFANNNLRSTEKVSVNISSVSGGYKGSGSVEIPIVSPKIIFYKKSPTEGILYNQALQNNFYMEEEEMTLVAEPYFLAFKGKGNDFTYDWKINNESINTPSKKTELTIRPSSRGGYATISLTLENLKTLFQKVSSNLRINL